MGLIDKFKNLFTEEVEEDTKPIKKEVRQVEIAAPKRETRSENNDIPISDSTAINKEEKFVFPVYFDDKDFDDLEKPKKVDIPAKRQIKQEAYHGVKPLPKVEAKQFHASPIISPVYGILDKNYKKEDIATRPEQPTDYSRKPRHMTVDDIRNKAFGTLEDDLQDTLFGKNSILFKEDESDLVGDICDTVLDDDIDLDIFKELKYDELEKIEEIDSEESKELNNEMIIEEKLENEEIDNDTIILAKQLEEQKKKLEEINDYINETSMEDDLDIEENTEEKENITLEENNEENKEKSKENEDLTESELLNLVDAMYEKRDEE